MIKKFNFIILAGFLLSLTFFRVGPLLAGRPAIEEIGDDVERIVVNETKAFSTTSPTRVAIGNPAIADVGDVSNTEITVNAKSPGTTTLVYWDVYGEQSVKIKVLSENMQLLKERIDSLLSALNLTTVKSSLAEDEGKVVLTGSVKTKDENERILTALGALKDKTVNLIKVKEEQAVIEIDVQILELNKGATNTLGITWPSSINLIEKGSPALNPLGTKMETLFKVLNLQRGTAAGPDPFTWKLDLLIKEGKARVLSRPRIACQSGKEAKLVVGGEVPILSSVVGGGGTTKDSGSASSSSVEYKEYGIILKIKPSLDDFKRVHLNLNVEVSEVGKTPVSTSYALAYPFTKRTAVTELSLDNGQTLAIGGLIKRKTAEDLQKFPWLADVPVLGMFFRDRITSSGGGFDTKEDTELFITMTPRIVLDGNPMTEENLEPKVKPVMAKNNLLIPDNVVDYASLVQKRVTDNLNYPKSAKDSGFQGTVRLNMHLSYLGELLDVGVKTSSGYKVLDENAIYVAEMIPSYPPFPSNLEQKDLWIEVPIVYRLN